MKIYILVIVDTWGEMHLKTLLGCLYATDVRIYADAVQTRLVSLAIEWLEVTEFIFDSCAYIITCIRHDCIGSLIFRQPCEHSVLLHAWGGFSNQVHIQPGNVSIVKRFYCILVSQLIVIVISTHQQRWYRSRSTLRSLYSGTPRSHILWWRHHTRMWRHRWRSQVGMAQRDMVWCRSALHNCMGRRSLRPCWMILEEVFVYVSRK